MQKQPCADVFQIRCSCRFRYIHRKTPVLESLFNKATGPQACNVIKKGLQQRCFLVNIGEVFKNNFFYRTPSVVASSDF